MKTRELITPGYRAQNGYIFNEDDCKRYNTIQEEINGFLAANMPLRDGILDYSCEMFKTITGMM